MAQGDGAAVGVDAVRVELQAAYHRKGLDGEGLVEFDRVEVADGPARAVQGPGGGRYRAEPHQVRLDPGRGGGDDTGPGSEPVTLHRRAARHHQGGGPVGQRRGVARGDDAARAERGAQPAQFLQRGGRAWPFVLGHLTVRPRHRDDLRRETARSLRGHRSTVAAQREGVGLQAGDAVQSGDLLRGLAHRQGRRRGEARVGETPAEGGVVDVARPRPGCARLGHHPRRTGHRLDAMRPRRPRPRPLAPPVRRTRRR